MAAQDRREQGRQAQGQQAQGQQARGRRTRADYERGLPDYHDPTAGFGGAAPTRSALTLRAVLAVFGLLFAVGAAWIGFAFGLGVLGWAMVVVAVIALGDLAWVLYRKGRGEPG